MLSAILRLLSHFYGPLYACNNLKLVYLCTLEALEIKNSLIVKKNTEKINHFKVVCYWGFRDPPTHPLVLAYKKNIDNSGRPLREEP